MALGFTAPVAPCWSEPACRFEEYAGARTMAGWHWRSGNGATLIQPDAFLPGGVATSFFGDGFPTMALAAADADEAAVAVSRVEEPSLLASPLTDALASALTSARVPLSPILRLIDPASDRLFDAPAFSASTTRSIALRLATAPAVPVAGPTGRSPTTAPAVPAAGPTVRSRGGGSSAARAPPIGPATAIRVVIANARNGRAPEFCCLSVMRQSLLCGRSVP